MHNAIIAPSMTRVVKSLWKFQLLVRGVEDHNCSTGCMLCSHKPHAMTIVVSPVDRRTWLHRVTQLTSMPPDDVWLVALQGRVKMSLQSGVLHLLLADAVDASKASLLNCLALKLQSVKKPYGSSQG